MLGNLKHPLFSFQLRILSVQLIYILVCLSIRLYPINLKTAEPIWSKFCVGPHMTPGKVYETSKLEGKKIP